MSKVLLSLDDELLRQIDRRARQAGLTRSAYVARVAMQDLRTAMGPGARAGVRQALARLDNLFDQNPTGDATEAIRSERDRR